ncbi:MAG TPA: hypothetical protein PKM67_09940, partial [Kiritimatiellia bacterium]|nr:hypothetical protein [Kiritimatiellia bacterium]
MTELSVKELDLLQRVGEKPELRSIFFRKVKGLKWFNALEGKGYFNPENNPKPQPAEEMGYYTVPHWHAINYLVNTAAELDNDASHAYAVKFLNVLLEATAHAKTNAFSNYHTWWQFAKIISYIPNQVISTENMAVIDYWLDDKFNQSLVAQEVGCGWLPKLLNINDEHAVALSLELLRILYKPVCDLRRSENQGRKKYILRYDSYHSDNITNRTAKIAGARGGKAVISIFESYLTGILRESGSDTWSSIWHPSIEDHEQNRYRTDAENVLIKTYRESLSGCIEKIPQEACELLTTMLDSEYQTIHRIAIHAISEHQYLQPRFIDRILNAQYLKSNYRHEMWQYLKRNYSQFSDTQKRVVIEMISALSSIEKDGKLNKGATAYTQAVWFAAIKDYGPVESGLYQKNVEMAGVEPDHPDFSSYMSSGTFKDTSSVSLDDLRSLPIDELVAALQIKEKDGENSARRMGDLSGVLKQLIKANANIYFN